MHVLLISFIQFYTILLLYHSNNIIFNQYQGRCGGLANVVSDVLLHCFEFDLLGVFSHVGSLQQANYHLYTCCLFKSGCMNAHYKERPTSALFVRVAYWHWDKWFKLLIDKEKKSWSKDLTQRWKHRQYYFDVWPYSFIQSEWDGKLWSI